MKNNWHQRQQEVSSTLRLLSHPRCDTWQFELTGGMCLRAGAAAMLVVLHVGFNVPYSTILVAPWLLEPAASIPR